MAQQHHSTFNIFKDKFMVGREEYEAWQAQLARIEAMLVVLLATDSSISIPTTSASETTGSTKVLYN